MLIRQLEGKSGLDRATIRFYEREGLIIPTRTENGYREYTQENLDDLLKIKLLRQLGMHLETIKEIKQGRESFSDALTEQIRTLEIQIQKAEKAKEVCKEISLQNPTYETLDAQYYLQRLSSLQSARKNPEFKEYVQRAYHPVRRFLARMADYALIRILVQFLLVVVFRVRPYGESLSFLVNYALPLVLIPVHSWFLSKWGKTPGKWLFDLSIRTEDGCLLSFRDALEREWRVFKEGYGFGIPVWSLRCMYKSYRDYQQGEPDWDWSNECIPGDWSKIRKTVLAFCAVILAAVTLWSANDVAKPKYRGDVTVSQFAANYNYYHQLQNDSPVPEYKMKPDGTWLIRESGGVVIYMDGQPKYPDQTFEFGTENSRVKTIKYSNIWTNVGFLNPVTSKCLTAAITAIMAEEGTGMRELEEFLHLIDEADLLEDGSIRYRNVDMIWKIDSENCTTFEGLYLIAADDSKPSWVSLDFQIRILD